MRKLCPRARNKQGMARKNIVAPKDWKDIAFIFVEKYAKIYITM